MRYVGGKGMLARWIRDVVLSTTPRRALYVEPFLGGGSTFTALAPHFADAIGADVVEDVALLWQAVAQGWEPPDGVSREEYEAQRNAPPSALRAFVGFGASFGGKWFGGYANRAEKTGRDDPRESARAVRKQAAAFAGRTILRAAFDALTPTPGAVLYCDPPYAGTQGYGAAGAFDTAAFWRTASAWSAAGADVFVSEEQAPEGWACVGIRERPAALEIVAGGRARTRRECIFYRPATTCVGQ